MRRRSFLKASGIALGTGLAANSLLAKIPRTILTSTTSAAGRLYPTGFIRGRFLPTIIPAGRWSWRSPLPAR